MQPADTDRPDIPWLDRTFFENQEKFPPEQLLPYAGQFIAWNWDRDRILDTAEDREQLWQKAGCSGDQLPSGSVPVCGHCLTGAAIALRFRYKLLASHPAVLSLPRRPARGWPFRERSPTGGGRGAGRRGGAGSLRGGWLWEERKKRRPLGTEKDREGPCRLGGSSQGDQAPFASGCASRFRQPIRPAVNGGSTSRSPVNGATRVFQPGSPGFRV